MSLTFIFKVKLEAKGPNFGYFFIFFIVLQQCLDYTPEDVGEEVEAGEGWGDGVSWMGWSGIGGPTGHLQSFSDATFSNFYNLRDN